ncbi:MAG: sulfite exporter TauE/SafE family protein [Clostridia bacterium]|nr:sulfite exporter TauE/SafE family protein [Clostridia bacterium]
MVYKAVFMIVLFIANTVQTITGFAGNLLAMPPSMHLVGYDTSKVILNIFTMTACLIISCENRACIQWKILFKMCLFMLAGMALGIKITEYFDLKILSYCYGAMIIAIALKKLFVKKEIIVPRFLMFAVLLGAGIIHGMFVSGGALLVIYAVTVLPDKDKFRATVAPVWVVLGIVMTFSHINSGLYTKENILLAALSLIPLLLSIKAGNIIYNKINQQTFLKITYVLLLCSGVFIFI